MNSKFFFYFCDKTKHNKNNCCVKLNQLSIFIFLLPPKANKKYSFIGTAFLSYSPPHTHSHNADKYIFRSYSLIQKYEFNLQGALFRANINDFPKKKKKNIMITQNMMIENPSTPNRSLPHQPSSKESIQLFAMNKENKNRIKLDYRYKKHFLHRRTKQNEMCRRKRNFHLKCIIRFLILSESKKIRDKLKFKELNINGFRVLLRVFFDYWIYARHGNVFNMTFK